MIKRVLFGGLGMFLLIPVVIGSVLYWAWAAWILWNWYAPLAGLEQATYAKVCALAALFSAIKGPTPSWTSDEESTAASLNTLIFGPLFSLAVGKAVLFVLAWL